MNKTEQEIISKSTEVVDNFFRLLGIKANLVVDYDSNNQAITVEVNELEEAGLLIGNRGRTINSLQIILSQIINQGLADWHRVLLNIAGWREKEERRLQELAIQTAERVRETGEAQSLYNLNSSERRHVHMALSNEKDIETKSEGEGEERSLTILLKQ